MPISFIPFLSAGQPRQFVTFLMFPEFEKMVRYIYSGDRAVVSGVKELDQLFEMYRLADQVTVQYRYVILASVY